MAKTMSTENDIPENMDPSHPDYDPAKDPLVQRAYWLMDHHPLCKLVTDVCRSHERLQRLAKMASPTFVLAEERKIREKALNALAAGIPINPDLSDGAQSSHTMGYTVAAFRVEIVDGLHNDPTVKEE